MCHVVRDERVVVHMLLLVSYHTAVARAFRTLAHQVQVQLVACDTVVQRDDVMVHPAVALLLDIHVAHPSILVVRLLQTVEVQFGVVAHKGLYHLCCQKVAVVSSMVAEQEFHLSALFHDNQYPTVHHQVHVRTQDIDYLDGTLHLHVLGHIDIQAVLRQHRVQVSGSVVVLPSQHVIVVC